MHPRISDMGIPGGCGSRVMLFLPRPPKVPLLKCHPDDVGGEDDGGGRGVQIPTE